MIYLDTSALVKLYVKEDHTALVQQVVAGQSVRTVAIAFVETLSAFARKKELSAKERLTASQEFLASWHHFRAIPTDRVLEAAGILARAHKLRAFDAIHLAAAMEMGPPRTVKFAVFDRELASAALKEGFSLVTSPE